eukprot:COSAG01_NODE_60820_length_292_cov_1.585492_1_plen_48_part_01
MHASIVPVSHARPGRQVETQLRSIIDRQRPGERLSMQRVEDSRHTLTP